MNDTYEPPIESHCARCLRPNPYPEGGSCPVGWEALTDDGEVVGVICEGCITPEEQQAMDEDCMDLMNVKILGLLDAGKSDCAIADEVSLPVSEVRRIIEFLREGE